MKFKVGDLVTCKHRDMYYYTNDRSICKVVGVNRSRTRDLVLKVIEHEYGHEPLIVEGNIFCVKSEHFKLIKPRFV